MIIKYESNNRGEQISQVQNPDYRISRPPNVSRTDKIVLGYTYDGLPFLITVVGTNRNGDALDSYIEHCITPCIHDYSESLSALEGNVHQITDAFIKKSVDNWRWVNPQLLYETAFKISIAVVYERNNKLFCSGFGIGDTGIALLPKGRSKIMQLVTRNFVDGRTDAFDSATLNDENYSLDLLILRNSKFTQEIQPGDELISYTRLQDSLQESKRFSCLGKTVEQQRLNISNIVNQSLYEKIREGVISDQDTTIAQIHVPSLEKREELKNFHLVSLGNTIPGIPDRHLKAKVQAVYDAAQALINKDEDVASVKNNIMWTNKLLDGSVSPHQYLNHSAEANGKSSTFGKVLGAAMISLALAVITCGILTFIGTIGVASSLSGYMFASGIVLFASGLGVVEKSRTSGLAKAMENLSAEVSSGLRLRA